MLPQVALRPLLRRCVPALALALFAAAPAARAESAALDLDEAPQCTQTPGASPDEEARFLAGLPVPETSPLRALQQGKTWEEHAKATERDWQLLEKKRLAPMRAWAASALWPHVKADAPTYYFFAGPDAISVEELYPASPAYYLCGLEPIVPLPALEQLSADHLDGALSNLRRSLRSTVSSSFFKTNDMAVDFRRTELKGVLPLLYFLVARSGAHIVDSRLVEIDPQGEIRDRAGDPAADAVGGVHLRLKRDGKEKEQDLYYFQLDLEDKAVALKPGFFPFWKRGAPGNAFLKAASFILHNGRFLETRRFLLGQSATILQDDSGIPFWTFARKSWDFYLFGRYLQPHRPFEKAYQRDLEAAFVSGRPAPLPFTTGYRLAGESNLVLVVRKGDGSPTVAGAEKQRP